MSKAKLSAKLSKMAHTLDLELKKAERFVKSVQAALKNRKFSKAHRYKVFRDLHKKYDKAIKVDPADLKNMMSDFRKGLSELKKLAKDDPHMKPIVKRLDKKFKDLKQRIA